MTETVLDIADVAFIRGGRRILDGISLTVRAGEHWALLGPNGAGKSTILKLCGALEHPSSGSVDVLGRRLGRVDMQELRRAIGHVNPRHPLESPLSVHEVVLTGLTGTVERPMRWSSTREDDERAHDALAQVGLGAKHDRRWPLLSQGERGRVLIARALVARPRILLLDEPTTGLDVAAREQLLETLDELSHSQPTLASLLVTHHLEELPETTSHAVVISEGRLLRAGTVDETITSETISRSFAHPIEVRREGRRWSARAMRGAHPAA